MNRSNTDKGRGTGRATPEEVAKAAGKAPQARRIDLGFTLRAREST